MELNIKKKVNKMEIKIILLLLIEPRLYEMA